MHDPSDQETVLQDLERLRDLFESDTLDKDSRRALYQLINETERWLAEIETGGAKAD
jgi:hypothetical protein